MIGKRLLPFLLVATVAVLAPSAQADSSDPCPDVQSDCIDPWVNLAKDQARCRILDVLYEDDGMPTPIRYVVGMARLARDVAWDAVVPTVEELYNNPAVWALAQQGWTLIWYDTPENNNATLTWLHPIFCATYNDVYYVTHPAACYTTLSKIDCTQRDVFDCTGYYDWPPFLGGYDCPFPTLVGPVPPKPDLGTLPAYHTPWASTPPVTLP